MWAMKCDLCNKPSESLEWWDGWLSFTFCKDCAKNHDAECWDVVVKAESERIRRGREYWATHPEELAKHNRETEEYRKTLDADGYPMNFKRPWWKRIVNWARRITGYTKYDRNGRERWTD